MKAILKRMLIFTLSATMVLTLFPTNVTAAEPGMLTDGNPDYDIWAMPLVSDKVSTLAPGITERKIVSYSTDGKRVEIFVTETDLSVGTTKIYASYKDNQNQERGMQKLTAQAASFESKHEGETVIAGINGSYFETGTGEPRGPMVMEGVEMPSSIRANNPDDRPYFAILKDGTPYIGERGTYSSMKDQIQEAIGGELILIRDSNNDGVGEPDFAAADYRETIELNFYQGLKYARQTVGITADGKVITMTADGHQGHSDGLIIEEQVDVMLSLGCVWALHLDGGGSATYAARPEGSDKFQVVNSPSDGSERNVSSALLIVSTAADTTEFNRATLTPEHDYVTPGSTVSVSAQGVSASGSSADIPENATWALADDTMGTVTDGVFVSSGKTGVAAVQLKVDGNVVGTANINVVVPDTISFKQSNITIPYTKSVALELEAKYGYNNVVLNDNDINFTLSSENLGIINGSVLTATSDTTQTGGTVTATLVHDQNITANVNIVFGRASEIVYDFEEGESSISNITLAYKENGYTPETANFKDYFGIVTAETGKVRNGQYAMMIRKDCSSTIGRGWIQTRYNGWGIDLTDATSLSFWMYIPEGSHGTEFDFGSAIPVQTGHEYTHGTGWQYFTIPVSEIGTTFFDQFRFYTNDSEPGAVSYPNYYADLTYYIDDITVNYSTAVDDNFAPIISDVVMKYGNDVTAEMNGQTISEDKIIVTARVADDSSKGTPSGVDTSTVKVFIDGNEVNATCDENGYIGVEQVALANGQHVVRIEATDNEGNETYLEKKVVIAKENNTLNTVLYAPLNAELNNLPAGSLYWTSLTATEINKVEKIEMVVELDLNSQWELDHMELAEGFEANYTVNKETNDAIITITRVGNVVETGEAVIAKLPIRVYKPNYSPETSEDWHWNAVVTNIENGLLVETDGNENVFSTAAISTNTEFNALRINKNDQKVGYHAHTTTSLADVAATCTEAGYKDRTYCEGCASIVEWGTTLPALGHHYEVVEGIAKCTNDNCGQLLTGALEGKEYSEGVLLNGWISENTYYYVDGVKMTGVYEVEGVCYNLGEDGVNKGKYTGLFNRDGKTYYSLVGEKLTGWQLVEEDYYCFNGTNGAALTGEQTIMIDAPITYVFAEDGKLTSGVWVTTGENSRYYYGPEYYYKGWQTIDGEEYYFDHGYCFKGKAYVTDSFSPQIKEWYEFDENGALIRKMDETGLFWIKGKLYSLVDGCSTYGMQKIDGNYYYFPTADGAAVVNGTYYCTNTVGSGLEVGNYDFDAEGKMILKNGLIEEDGELYYYVDGAKTYAGLIEIDGDYYYINSSCKAVKGEYNVWKTNDLMPQATYTFGEDGKMINPPVPEPEKDGIVEEDGVMYYYVDGEKYYAGLIEIDGDYYYVNSKFVVVTGEYTIWKTNDLMPQDTYVFDEDGKMIIEDDIKNGIVKEDGVMYYYVDGEKYYAGLIEIDGDYYYVNSNCIVVTGKYTIWKTNGLMEAKAYTFDVNGKMIKESELKNGIVKEDGVMYYYEDGVKTYAGLIEIDGDYYYVNSKFVVVTGEYSIFKTNDIMPQDTYEFAADGKMINPPVESTKDGIVKEDGVMYYYVDGEKYYAGLIEIDGDYYYVNSKFVVVTGEYSIWKTNGLLPEGTYKFDTNGKMINPPVVDTNKNGIVKENGAMYYYENGALTYAGLIEIDGDYYYVNSSCKVVTGKYTIWKTNDLMEAKEYTFAADGKMIQ